MEFNTGNTLDELIPKAVRMIAETGNAVEIDIPFTHLFSEELIKTMPSEASKTCVKITIDFAITDE
jgi:hypothetical protein